MSSLRPSGRARPRSRPPPLVKWLSAFALTTQRFPSFFYLFPSAERAAVITLHLRRRDESAVRGTSPAPPNDESEEAGRRTEIEGKLNDNFQR
jgi:hypothetical protein